MNTATASLVRFVLDRVADLARLVAGSGPARNDALVPIPVERRRRR